MKRASRAPLLAAACAAILAGLVPGARAAPLVDQSFTVPGNLGADINECCRFLAQTFTAGRTGVLEGINIDVTGFKPSRLHVAIRTVEGGRPTSTVLTETTLDSNSAPLSRLITFPAQVTVAAGMQYAIVVNYEGAPPPGADQGQGIWSGAIGDVYPRGALLSSALEGVSWSSPNTEGDVHFRTYVSVPGEVQLTGETRLLPDGDVILLDGEGRGHRLRTHPVIQAQLAALAGRTMTVVGSTVEDPAAVPHYPVLVRDFRLEPGGAFNFETVLVVGQTIRLPDGGAVVYDAFGRGHRLRGTGAVAAEIDRLAGKRVEVEGTASVTNTAARLTWPIDVVSMAEVA
jgi:hypothetical protein